MYNSLFLKCPCVWCIYIRIGRSRIRSCCWWVLCSSLCLPFSSHRHWCHNHRSPSLVHACLINITGVWQGKKRSDPPAARVSHGVANHTLIPSLVVIVARACLRRWSNENPVKLLLIFSCRCVVAERANPSTLLWENGDNDNNNDDNDDGGVMQQQQQQ